MSALKQEPAKQRFEPYTWRDEIRWYYQHFHWLHFLWFIVVPFPFCLAARHVRLTQYTFLMSTILHVFGGMSITVGYHRLWTHRSFRAHPLLKYGLAILGAGQCQWDIIWWVHHHRAHHQYTDTDRDPYNAKRGFFFSHVGWLIGHNPASYGQVDVSDVVNDPVAKWQKKYYVPLAIAVGCLLPTAIAHYGWGDWEGGFLYGTVARVTVTSHSTFLVNSWAHSPWAGTQPHSSRTTARNVPLAALLTAGEGNHNFHHKFPSDYRNGTAWYEPDWSQWFIRLCERLGLAWDLKTTGP